MDLSAQERNCSVPHLLRNTVTIGHRDTLGKPDIHLPKRWKNHAVANLGGTIPVEMQQNFIESSRNHVRSVDSNLIGEIIYKQLDSAYRGLPDK